MFGYLRPYKPELKMREFSVYKAVYCGLCRTIGKRYGFFMRNVLSYDATLFCLLGLSLQQDCRGFEPRHCPVKPYKTCDMARRCDEIDFWADTSVMLAYYKLKDNLHDESAVKKALCLLALPFAASARKKAAKNSPYLADCLTAYVTEQAAVEAKNSASVDEAAQPTAALISRLLTYKVTDKNRLRVLERMGIFLGRWIYICDAADDFRQDMKNGGYNPFVAALRGRAGEGRAQGFQLAAPLAGQMLNSCIYEITSAFELLPAARFREILANAFYLGLPEVEKAVLSGLSDKEKRKRFRAIYKI